MNRVRIRNIPELSDEELRQFTWTESSKPGGGKMQAKLIERNWRMLKKYYTALREMKGDDKRAVTALVLEGADFGVSRDLVHLTRRPVYVWLLSQQPVAKPAASPEGWREAMSPEQSGHLGGKFSGISKRLDELDALYTQTDDRILAVAKKLDEYIAGVADVIDKLERRSRNLIGNNSAIGSLIERMKNLEDHTSNAAPELNRRITLLENGAETEREQAKSWIPGRGR